MRLFIFRLIAFAAWFALVLSASIGTMHAHEFAAKTVHIDHPWAKPTRAAGAPGLVYFTLESKGAEGDRLLRVEVDGKVAERAELRRIAKIGGKVQISHLADGLDVPADASIAPGYYVLLGGLTEALTEGHRFPITLVFERGGAVEVEVVVEAAPKPVKHPVAARHEGHGS